MFISNLTRIEIDKTPDKDLRKKMQEQVSEITIVPPTSAVQQLTEEYIRYEAISENYIEDAYHIAIAVVNNLDIVASWNFRHIVRRKTKDIVSMVNGKNNYKHVEIMTPAELL